MQIKEKLKNRLTIKTKAIIVTLLDLIMITVSIYKWFNGTTEFTILWVLYIVPLICFILSLVFECVYFDSLLEKQDPILKGYDLGVTFFIVGASFVIGLVVLFWLILDMFFDGLHTALSSI